MESTFHREHPCSVPIKRKDNPKRTTIPMANNIRPQLICPDCPLRHHDYVGSSNRRRHKRPQTESIASRLIQHVANKNGRPQAIQKERGTKRRILATCADVCSRRLLDGDSLNRGHAPNRIPRCSSRRCTHRFHDRLRSSMSY